MSKTRPCVIISPDELNEYLKTLIIIPLTSTIKDYPWRVNCKISGKESSIATDQIKVIDRVRIGSKIGKLSKEEIIKLKNILQKMLID